MIYEVFGIWKVWLIGVRNIRETFLLFLKSNFVEAFLECTQSGVWLAASSSWFWIWYIHTILSGEFWSWQRKWNRYTLGTNKNNFLRHYSFSYLESYSSLWNCRFHENKNKEEELPLAFADFARIARHEKHGWDIQYLVVWITNTEFTKYVLYFQTLSNLEF